MLQVVRPVIGNDDVANVVAAAGDAGEDDGLHANAAALEKSEHRARRQVGIHEADAGQAHDDALSRDGAGEEPAAVEHADFGDGPCRSEDLRALGRERGENEHARVARPRRKGCAREKRARH